MPLVSPPLKVPRKGVYERIARIFAPRPEGDYDRGNVIVRPKLQRLEEWGGKRQGEVRKWRIAYEKIESERREERKEE